MVWSALAEASLSECHSWTIAMRCWLAFHYTLYGTCNPWWTWPHDSSLRHRSATHHAAPTPITLAESSVADRLQAGRPGLQMSSWPGTVITCRRTSPSSRVRVSKASPFRFILWTVYSPYPTVNLQQPRFSSCHCTDLEQSSAAYHICSVTSCCLLLLEDILLQTLLPVITVVVSAKWHCHLWTR